MDYQQEAAENTTDNLIDNQPAAVESKTTVPGLEQELTRTVADRPTERAIKVVTTNDHRRTRIENRHLNQSDQTAEITAIPATKARQSAPARPLMSRMII